MAEVGKQIASNPMDSYLSQAVPMLQTCKQAFREITQRDLKIQGKDEVLVVSADAQQAKRVRSRNQSGTDVKSNVDALVLIEQVKMFADKLRDVVFRIIIANDEMKKDDSTLSRKIKRLTELKNSLDELTRLLDTIVTFYSARFLGFHSMVKLPELEEVNKLKENLNRLKIQLTSDNLSYLFDSYDAEFNISKEVIICTILGLNDDYGAYLQELDKEYLMHQSILYYLQKSILGEEGELEADGPLYRSGNKVLEENLCGLGFNKETAKIITQQIPDEFVDLQKPSFWAVRYLDHVYHHHPLMSSYIPKLLVCQQVVFEFGEIKLPFDDSKRYFEVAKLGLSEINVCVGETCGSYDETEAAAAAQLGLSEMYSGIKKLDLTERNSEDVCAVTVIDISSDISQGNVFVEKFLKKLTNDENCLFFHGTTHENAMSVVANGIILTRGEVEQDFSHGDGFYLSDKFENAKAWSQAGRGEHQAVVVYNVKRSLLNEGNGLDLSLNPAQWEEVVRCCRNGYRNEKTSKDLEKYAFIQGPPCKNPADSEGTNPLLRCEEAGIQLCIRDDSFAEEFGSLTNVACVIVY